MTALSKSKPVVSMARLAQLLEERQEPFKLEVYLSERRYTKKSFDRIGSRKVKWRIAIPNGSKILKLAINKLVSYKNCQKSVHCKDRGIPAFGRGNKQQHNAVRNFTSLGFPLPCQSTFQASKLHNLRDLEVATNTKDSKQLSPVSVLEELPSNEAKKEEIKPISGFNFPRKAKSTYLCEFLLQSLTEKHNCVSETELQDVKSSSDQHLKPKQVSMQTKQLLFNCVTEAMDTYGKQGRRQRSGREGLGPEEFGKVICGQISSLEEQYGDVKYINQLIDLNGMTEEWRNFQRWNKEIGKVIADAVLDDIITETINFELRSCFGFDTFFATDVRRFGDGGIFIGNLRKPVEEAIPKLERKLSEAAGTEVVLWLMEEKSNDITKQVCMVQPKAEMDLQFESTKLSTPWGYVSAITLCVATFGTIALMSGFFLKPNATFDDYVSEVVPLFGGFLSILGVSEIATRVTAARYGVKLSPSFLVPSNWTGCLGVMNNYESLLPNKKALFDIPMARTASAYLTSLVLAIAAFVADGSFNGGDNALYIRPQFFYNNPLLSFVQYVIGPYADDLGNVLPYAVEGVGVPVDPLAFAGLLGMVVTSLNLLPCGRLEGGRIAQAMFGRSTATLLSFATSLLLGIGGLSGSVLCLAWGLFATFFRGGEEVPAKDEITPLGDDRYAWGFILGLICFLTLFPNGGGTFSSSFFSDPFFRGDL